MPGRASEASHFHTLSVPPPGLSIILLNPDPYPGACTEHSQQLAIDSFQARGEIKGMTSLRFPRVRGTMVSTVS